jgi:hypothetical protein
MRKTFYFNDDDFGLHDDAQVIGIADADGNLLFGQVSDSTWTTNVHDTWLTYFRQDIEQRGHSSKVRDLRKMALAHEIT